MTIGRPLARTDIDTTAASLAGQLFSVLDNISKLNAIMDGYASSDLVTLFGYAQGDADQLKSALSDMQDVYTFWTGGVPGVQRDRRTFARHLLGTGVY